MIMETNIQNTTITIWVRSADEIYFFTILKVLDELPIENDYKWQTNDIVLSKEMVSHWTCVNIPLSLYVKLKYSLSKNGSSLLK